MAILPDKREILQSIIDTLDDLWIIIKPSRNNPNDPDYLCVFQNPAQYKEAQIEIPMHWFTQKKFDKIEKAVRDAFERAEIGYKYT